MEQHMWQLLNAGPLKLLMLLCTLQCFNGHLVVTEYIHNVACLVGSGQGLKVAQQQICAPGTHKRLIQPYLLLDSPSLCCQGRKGTNIITGDGIIVHFSDRDRNRDWKDSGSRGRHHISTLHLQTKIDYSHLLHKFYIKTGLACK